jgi:hypothetical protein
MMSKYVTNLEKNVKMHCQKIWKYIFNFFFKLSQSNPLLGFYSKNRNFYSIYLVKTKENRLHHNYLGLLKLYRRNNYWKFLVFSLYVMRDTVSGKSRRADNFQALLEIDENGQQFIVVSSLKGWAATLSWNASSVILVSPQPFTLLVYP